jgi:hypothetical protein
MASIRDSVDRVNDRGKPVGPGGEVGPVDDVRGRRPFV